MKKACSIFIAALLIFVLAGSAVPASAAGGMEHFLKVKEYSGQFSDVKSSEWYYNDVTNAYEYGLVTGTDGKYNPSGNVSIAEAVTFAARIRCIYYQDELAVLDAPKGGAWYSGSVAYLQSAGLNLSGFTGRYTAAATRIEVAFLFNHALAPVEFPVINEGVASAPDVLRADSRATDVLALYRAGITTGSDKYGNFEPASSITRAETAAIAGRVILPGTRKQFMPEARPVTVTPSRTTVYVGLEQALTATPKHAFNCPVKTLWVSQNPDIATVDLFGFVHGIAAGTTDIYFQSADGKPLGQASVTVEALPLEADRYDNCAKSEVWLFSYDTQGNMVNRSLGVVVSSSGIIITSCDALRGAQNIAAFFKDRIRQAFIASYDEKRNIAILKIDAKVSPDFRYVSHYRMEAVLKPFENVVSLVNTAAQSGDDLYALSIADVSSSFYFNVNSTSYLMPAFVKCIVAGKNPDGMLKLKAEKAILVDGTMLFTSEGKLAGVLKPDGYLKDTGYSYAVPVTSSDATPGSGAIAENVKLKAGTCTEGQFVCNELDTSISANMFFGVMRGRTMTATIQNADDEDSYMMIEKSGDINVILRSESLPAGTVEMSLISRYGKIVSKAVPTKDGLHLTGSLTGNAPCFLVVHVGEKVKSGAFIPCGERYTLYFY